MPSISLRTSTRPDENSARRERSASRAARYPGPIALAHEAAGAGLPLRVAVLAPLAWRTPPRHYGPWEQFVSLLTEGLVARGHDVTLFATADSVTSATLVRHQSARVVRGRLDRSQGRRVRAHRVVVRTGRRVRRHPQRIRLPSADVLRARRHTGGDDDPRVLLPAIVAVYERYDATTSYVAISDADRHPLLHYAATIHHGIDTRSFAIDAEPGDRLLYFGRIHPDKGTADAIEVARRTGRRLDIAGIIQDEAYFRTEVEPHIDGEFVRFLGPVDASSRAASSARRTPCST